VFSVLTLVRSRAIRTMPRISTELMCSFEYIEPASARRPKDARSRPSPTGGQHPREPTLSRHSATRLLTKILLHLRSSRISRASCCRSLS
jgi:hypothetical protein